MRPVMESSSTPMKRDPSGAAPMKLPVPQPGSRMVALLGTPRRAMASCMDAITVDVSDVPGVQVGDPVTLIGRDGDEVVTSEEVAEWSSTISYEVLTSIGPRVERRYPG